MLVAILIFVALIGSTSSLSGCTDVYLTVNGYNRTFCYIVPPGVNAATAPVFMFFHGNRGDANQMQPFVAKGKDLGFVMIGGKNLALNPNERYWSPSRDEPYVAAVVTRVQEQLGVGTVNSSWYGAGWSAGSSAPTASSAACPSGPSSCRRTPAARRRA